MTIFTDHEKQSCMNGQTISSVRDLVAAYGGTGKFAEFLHVVPSAVSNMLAQNEIPRGYHLEIYLDSERRGWKVDKAKVFGLEDPAKGSRKPNPKRRTEARVA